MFLPKSRLYTQITNHMNSFLLINLYIKIVWVNFDRKLGKLGSARKPLYQCRMSKFQFEQHKVARTFVLKSCEFIAITEHAEFPEPEDSVHKSLN